mgnify:FL=1
MELLAHARIVIWEGASLWVVDATKVRGPGPRRTDFHAHHAIQITFSLGGVFKLATENASVESGAAAVAADAPHVFEAEGLMALLFVEPESRAGRALGRKLFSDARFTALPPEIFADIGPRLAQAFRARARDDAFIDLGRTLITKLAGDIRGDAPDLRVRQMIAHAMERIEGPVSLADVAGASKLSASRLRHLFVEQTGLPFKTYVLWLRLTRAVEAFAAGAPLTQAAHDAGFADSAHLSRTFRRMFGIAPTALRIT